MERSDVDGGGFETKTVYKNVFSPSIRIHYNSLGFVYSTVEAV